MIVEFYRCQRRYIYAELIAVGHLRRKHRVQRMGTLDYKHHLRSEFQMIAVELALALLKIVCRQFNILARQHACERFIEIRQVNRID